MKGRRIYAAASHMEVYETGDGWDLHWKGDNDPFGCIGCDEDGIVFQPYDDALFAFTRDETVELAALISAFPERG